MLQDSCVPSQRARRRPKFTADIVVYVCQHLASGGEDLLSASRVCRSWRQAILSSPLLWRDLTITQYTGAPHLKAHAFAMRAAAIGLRTLRIDMTFDWYNPPTRPARVSGLRDGKSTFQRILHALDGTVRATGAVHRLDALQYYSRGSWHGADMAYLGRFLLRPYVQPRVVTIRSRAADPAATPADFGGWWWVPMLPKFNARLREFRVCGLADVRFRWEPAGAEGPGSHHFPNTALRRLKLVRVGIRRGEKNDVPKILAGLMLADAVRAESAWDQHFRAPERDFVFERCPPGEVDKAVYRTEMFVRAWSARPLDRGEGGESMRLALPPLALPALEELVVGTYDFALLRRLDAPRLHTLIVGTANVIHHSPAEVTAIVRSLLAGLAHLGKPLRVLDMTHICIKDSGILARLHELCPDLEVLRLGDNYDFSRDEIKAYITTKAASDTGTRRLKVSEHTVASYSDLRTWAQDYVDYVPGGRWENQPSIPYPAIMEDVERLPPLDIREVDEDEASDSDDDDSEKPSFGRLSEPDEATRWRQDADSMSYTYMNVFSSQSDRQRDMGGWF
jgi:hypothetical protein